MRAGDETSARQMSNAGFGIGRPSNTPGRTRHRYNVLAESTPTQILSKYLFGPLLGRTATGGGLCHRTKGAKQRAVLRRADWLDTSVAGHEGPGGTTTTQDDGSSQQSKAVENPCSPVENEPPYLPHHHDLTDLALPRSTAVAIPHQLSVQTHRDRHVVEVCFCWRRWAHQRWAGGACPR